MGALGHGAAFFVDMGQRSILDVGNQHVPVRRDFWSSYQTLASLPVCWQLLTRWPLTHASQAYFSPSINIPAVKRNPLWPINRPEELGYAQCQAARETALRVESRISSQFSGDETAHSFETSRTKYQ